MKTSYNKTVRIIHICEKFSGIVSAISPYRSCGSGQKQYVMYAFGGYHALIINKIIQHLEDIIVSVCRMSNGVHVGDERYVYVSMSKASCFAVSFDQPQKTD